MQDQYPQLKPVSPWSHHPWTLNLEGGGCCTWLKHQVPWDCGSRQWRRLDTTLSNSLPAAFTLISACALSLAYLIPMHTALGYILLQKATFLTFLVRDHKNLGLFFMEKKTTKIKIITLETKVSTWERPWSHCVLLSPLMLQPLT